MSYAVVPNTNLDTSPMGHTSYRDESKENIELSPVGRSDSYRSVQHAYYTNSEPHATSAVHLTREHEARRTTLRGRTRGIMRSVWLTMWMPAIAFAYLAFCYAAATRVIPVRIWSVDQPTEHLWGIKAGVTTVNIIIIAVALLPVKSLLDDLKSEEFFRRLRTAQKGVPLNHINDVSTPSHAISKGLISVVRRQATKYYAGAILSSIIAMLVSSLAPAALSVGIIPVDNELRAFRVGAVARDSIYVSNSIGAYQNLGFSAKSTEAASMGWVQTTLGIDMTFKPTSLKYAVPVPLDLTPKSRARWMTDVIVMDPVCNWALSDPPILLPPGVNVNTSYTTMLNLTLPMYGVGSSFHMSVLQSGYSKVATAFSDSVGAELYNLTNMDPPTQGTMAWLIAQCTSCSAVPGEDDPAKIDFTGIPVQQLTLPKFVGTNVTSLTDFDVGVLVCNPRATIETREVRMSGGGGIEVMEDGKTYVRQGNLQLTQTRLLLTKSLRSFSSNSGPDTGFRGVGKAAQIRFMFGPTGNATETTTLTPLPIDQLTEGYAVLQQAAMRSYLSGSMATAYVPGRTQALTLVFTSSLPHVIISTVLFSFIALFINLCYLRSDNEQFTLFAVSAALAKSNLPGICEDIRCADQGRGAMREDIAVESLRGKRVRLVNEGGPGHALRLE